MSCTTQPSSPHEEDRVSNPPTTPPSASADGTPAAPDQERPGVLRQIAESSALLTLLAVLAAAVVGSVLIWAAGANILDAYAALIRGSVFDWNATSTIRQWRPLTETLTNSVPLILAGLGMTVAFRAGLFNIGGQGQVVLGAIVGGYIGFTWDLPPVVHVLVAMLGTILGGVVWAGIAGILKARTGASEVIVTIMLNSVAGYLLAQMLTTAAFIGVGKANPKSMYIAENAEYPLLLGHSFRLHAGFIVALLAAGAVWWLLERSQLGFQIRATGLNSAAACTAGINVGRITVITMAISGALCGLAASGPVLGTQHYLISSVAGSIGFDAITVALLGRSRPLGTVLAGILFGGLAAGGSTMQAATGTPIDIILVLQSTIVLFIAAPPLVRTIFRLPQPGSWKKHRPSPVTTAPAAAQEA